MAGHVSVAANRLFPFSIRLELAKTPEHPPAARCLAGNLSTNDTSPGGDMEITAYRGELSERIHKFVKEGFTPHFGELTPRFPTNPLWAKLRALGTELWLDSGDIDEITPLWTREFTALTTNNTLLNKEVQKGTYDDLLPKAAKLLSEFPTLTEVERKLELAFIVNAVHGLRLVEKFDAYVSVEEHTDLTSDLEAAVNYARRYFAICPERFYVKLPFSPAGLLATRRLSAESVPVNHTLGFSARQNYLITRVGRPAFVNVFMGRLNSFVADNKLGDGAYVGEKATLASQAVVRALRTTYNLPTRQIGASFRAPGQVRDLAGMDVMTIPCKVAKGFLALGIPPADLTDKTHETYSVRLAPGVDERDVRLDTLWEIEDALATCVDKLEREDLSSFTSNRLVDFLAANGCGDIFPRWSKGELATSAKEGKIPQLANWRSLLADKKVGLDTLLNLGGWNSFNADETQMDDRIKSVLSRRGA
jgi:transaldolase